jgi:SAM-dependent methyltransferase
MSKEYGPEYFDADYYRPGSKSTYEYPYTWANEAANFIRKADNIINTYRPKRVLDVGSAKGFLVKALLMRGVDAYGIDISNWAIQNCEPEVRGRLVQCWLKAGIPIPAETGQYDLVISESTMEHIHMDDVGWVLKEMARVSSKWVVLELPVELGWNNKPLGDPTHQTYLPPAYWIAKGWDAGLICDIRQSHHKSQPPFQDAHLVFRKDRLDDKI